MHGQAQSFAEIQITALLALYICVLGKKVNVHRYTDSILRRYSDESRIMQCHENCRDSEELLAHTLEVYNVLSCKYFVMKRNLLTTAPIASSRFVATCITIDK